MNESELQAILRATEQAARAAAQLLKSVPQHEGPALGSRRAPQRDPLEDLQRYAGDHPWRTLCIATGLGLLTGLMLSRRSRRGRDVR